MEVTVSGIGVEAIDHSPESPGVRTQFDREKTSASVAIVATLAEAMDADPVELTPLYASVDPDALEALVWSRDETGGETHVTFTHEGHAIGVHSYGVVTVTPLEHEPAAKGGVDR